MTKELLIEYIESGREIEFKYNDKMYSITYGNVDGKEVISFCQFYCQSTEVETVDELLNISRDDVTVCKMWETLDENNIWVY